MKTVNNIKSAISNRWMPLRIIAALIALAIIAFLLWGATELLGNPISYFRAKNGAEKHIAEKYAEEGYVITNVDYSFKFKNYYARAEKPGSEDCQFTVSFNSKGELLADDYEKRILNGSNVRTRIDALYRELADSVFKSSAFPYSSDIAYGTLIFKGDDESELQYDFGLSKSILVPDGQYNIAKLGEQAGLLTIYINTNDLTDKNAAGILLELKSLAERGGVPFYAVELTLKSASGEYYTLGTFRSADIYEEGLVERVNESHQKETARLETLDNQKKA